MVWFNKFDYPTALDDADEASSKILVPSMQLLANDASSYLGHTCALDIESKPSVIRLSGIICTIGPVTRRPAVLLKMMETGMNICRLNLSHGSHEYHAETIKNIRETVAEYSKKLGTTFPLAIALDTKGPEIRTGILEGGLNAEIELKKGESIKVTTDPAFKEKVSNQVIYVDYGNIQNVVSINNRIYIDDGLLSLLVTSIAGAFMTCTIENGGRLGSNKGVNLPGVRVDLPNVSENDIDDIKFGIEQEVDILMSSFIRSADALGELRSILGERGKDIKIVSKIENEQGMQNLEDIIKVSDGIMVARGDLGIELLTEKLFLAQKSIIARCNIHGVPVIVARELLDSMGKKPRPTRAESSDVANAVLDGADCVMLSEETNKGEYPIECIQTLDRICKEAEAASWQKQVYGDLNRQIIPPVDAAHTLAIAAVEAATKCIAPAIIVITTSGKIAHLMSKYRPRCPIIAVTRNGLIARQCHLFRGILPLQYLEPALPDLRKDIEIRVQFAIRFGKNRGFIKAGDPVVIVPGTNTMRIDYIQEDIDSLIDLLLNSSTV